MLNAIPSIRSWPVRVLAIDGHQIVLFSILHMLSGSGYRVREASSGRQGLELAQEGPDVILLDVTLPDGSGVEFCRQLKADSQTRSIPVILISHAYDAENARQMGLEAGAHGVIEFPLTPEKLVTQISRVIEDLPPREQRGETKRLSIEEKRNDGKQHIGPRSRGGA